MAAFKDAQVIWQSGLAFEGTAGSGFSVRMDTTPDEGGGSGFSPMELVLLGLASCTAMDVISILRKMRVPVEGFSVHVKADLTPNHPRVFTTVRITYRFRGKELPMDKLETAVKLSQEKYCGVSAMLRKAAELTYEIQIE